MSIKNERLLIRAKKLLKKGNVSEARELYSGILQSFPNNQEAQKGLSILEKSNKEQLSQKQLDEVMEFYSQGQIDKAQLLANNLINNFPQESLLYNILGACYSEIGPIDSAIENFEQAIALKPDYAEAYYNLGVAYQKNGQINNSLNSYEKAVELKHAYPQAHNNIGLLNMHFGNLDSAVTSLEWALAYSPNYAEAHNNLGAVFQELSLYQEAMEQYEKATLINPNYALAFNNLGISSEIMGLRDKAKVNYEQAINIDSSYAEAHRNLSAIKQYTKVDSQVDQMVSLYSKNSLNQSDRINLCFALAKVNENLNNESEFFKYLDEGNKLRKQDLNYSYNSIEKFHSNLAVTAKSFPSLSKKLVEESLTKKPVFIVGMPRSGSSLVEQIISSHKNVYGAGELKYLKTSVNPYIENITNKDLDKNLTKKDLINIRNEYFKSIEPLKIKEAAFTDKMPLNFEYIGFILKAFPEAKIIHLKRDARAVCWSIYKNFFSGKGNGWAYNMNDIVDFYCSYVKTMNTWHEMFPNQIYDISYEKLTENQQVETQKLLKYCDLEWDENCLNFHKNTRGVVTASSSQVRKKMYQGSSEAWKKYETYLQPFIKALESY